MPPEPIAAPPPNPSTRSNLLSTHRALLDTLASFLTVTTHHILFLRRIYPPVSFVSTRAFNYPVRQNRHPDVCAWINDAVAAVRDQMERNTVAKVALCIFECNRNRVLERWVFDLHAFPSIAKRDQDVPFSEPEDAELQHKINLSDLEATFRATLSRLGHSASRLQPLPEGDSAPECSFTMTVDIKDGAKRPVGRIDKHERQWIAAEPDLFDKQTKAAHKGLANEAGDVTTGKTFPVRRLEAGEMKLEVWVEESAAKLSYPSSQPTASERNASMSYGAGTEKFNPLVGYELEEPDINRKSATGADYHKG